MVALLEKIGGQTAVDEVVGAGDETCVVGGEEGDGLGHLFGGAEAALLEGDELVVTDRDDRFDGGGQAICHLGLDQAWADGVDANPSGAKFDGGGLGEPDNSGPRLARM